MLVKSKTTIRLWEGWYGKGNEGSENNPKGLMDLIIENPLPPSARLVKISDRDYAIHGEDYRYFRDLYWEWEEER